MTVLIPDNYYAGDGDSKIFFKFLPAYWQQTEVDPLSSDIMVLYLILPLYIRGSAYISLEHPAVVEAGRRETITFMISDFGGAIFARSELKRKGKNHHF